MELEVFAPPDRSDPHTHLWRTPTEVSELPQRSGGPNCFTQRRSFTQTQTPAEGVVKEPTNTTRAFRENQMSTQNYEARQSERLHPGVVFPPPDASAPPPLRPPQISSSYHRKTVYTLAWGPAVPPLSFGECLGGVTGKAAGVTKPCETFRFRWKAELQLVQLRW